MFDEKIFNKDLSQKAKKEIGEEITERVRELQQTGEKIGEGLSARVFVSKSNPDICYKINYNNERFHNSPSDEGDFLRKSKLSGDVLLPEPFYSIVTGDNPPFEALVMRRLNAVSIKDIIEGNSPVPPGFDFERFFLILKDFFEKLHASKIFHCDVRSGNIMIDNKTGKPCIIDFGLSRMEYLSSENPYVMKNSKGDIIPLLDDIQGLKEIRLELKKYLYSKSKST